MRQKTLIGVSILMSFMTLYALQMKSQTIIPGPSGQPKHDPPVTKPLNKTIGEAGNDTGFDMAPETTPKVVQAAVSELPSKIPEGSFKPEWESIAKNYTIPEWFIGAKFGLFMHWGLYAVPGYKSEWYEKHMYGDPGVAEWHKNHFGPQGQFGYKDFIPLFTQDQFNPDQWAELFKKSGAKFIIPTAQHHDNFALWDSQKTPYNAMKMGPKRDLIGELAQAVRRQGLKFGVSNHGIENFQFINPPADMLNSMMANQSDLFAPEWKDFYNVADRSDEACKNFLINWYERNVELIDKYQPDMLWFDNGIDQRYLDPLKLQVAAYYYNRAEQWGKEVSISSKKAAFAPAGTNLTTIGSILDFEGHIPQNIRTGVWQVDSKIGSTWGYTQHMSISSAQKIIATLADIVSKNGTLLLNISPKADGTIPNDQQKVLLEIGQWLSINGEAIYDTHNWIKFGETSKTTKIRYTVSGNNLYAILLGASSEESITLSSLASDSKLKGSIKKISVLGNPLTLTFKQTEEGLILNLPQSTIKEQTYVIKIEGLELNNPTWTNSGNPIL